MFENIPVKNAEGKDIDGFLLNSLLNDLKSSGETLTILKNPYRSWGPSMPQWRITVYPKIKNDAVDLS